MVLWGKTYGISGCVYIYVYSVYIYIHIDIWIPGFSKKNSHPMKYHTTDVVSPPSPNSCCLVNFVFGGLQEKQPFLLMMRGTSDHNIEVGVVGEGKVSMWFPVDGCFFEEPDVYIIYGYIYIHTYWAYHGGDSVGCASQCG